VSRLRQKHRFALGILAGIGFAGLLSHGVASAVHSLNADPLDEIPLSVQALDAQPFVDLSAAQQGSAGLLVADGYAQSLGYRDWNHYLAHRPSNKMGEREAAPVSHREPAATKPQKPATPPVESAPPADESETALVISDPVVADPLIADRYVVDRIGGDDYCCTHTYLDKPVVSVPEPSPVWLLGAGLVALILRKRKFA
jgi:hypothetical protein